VLTPDAIPPERLARFGARGERLAQYPGLKEEYYLADFEPDASILTRLGIDPARILVVVRPPPEVSMYHAENPLYGRLLDRLGAESEATAVVIPRTEQQASEVRDRGEPSLLVPDGEVDAQSLIAQADLVVSAGGTMNREAVALGTPVYTTFSGRLGAVDERLIEAGRLRPLADPDALELRKRDGPAAERERRDPGLLVDLVLGAVPQVP
jgi:predicted glycosyltransferase